MKGYPLVYLLAMALVAFCTPTRAKPSPSCSLSATEISKEIQDKGVHEVVHRLTEKVDGQYYDSTGYTLLVDCLWDGKKEWLDIAVPLVTEWHPDSGDDITDAIQHSLAVNPEAVLSEPWPSYFTVWDYICTVVVDDYQHYEGAIVDLNERVSAVKRIKDPSLKSKVDECLAGFEKTRVDLARFFQVTAPPRK